MNLNIRNPFPDEHNPRHPYPRQIIVLKEGVTNGYVKFSLGKKPRWVTPTPYQYGGGFPNNLSMVRQIPRLPANFGRNMILEDQIDHELWKFCKISGVSWF